MTPPVQEVLGSLRWLADGRSADLRASAHGTGASAVQLLASLASGGKPCEVRFYALGSPVLIAACEFWLRQANAVLEQGDWPSAQPQQWLVALSLPREHLGELLLVEDAWLQLCDKVREKTGDRA
ncbi:MAG: hypothetical protein AAGA84_11230 [Pseudomonadota bacterium]